MSPNKNTRNININNNQINKEKHQNMNYLNIRNYF